MQSLSKSATWPLSKPERPAGLCLLVVEDDDADAYLICRALSGHPAVGEVVRAIDGVEALRMVESGEVAPDLAFIDLHMPRMNGFSLLVAFAEQPEPVFPIVVLTSSTAPADAMRSRLKGAIRVFSKPDTLLGLQARLDREIRRIKPQFVEPIDDETPSQSDRHAEQ